jgi:AcrR family transcriptional regulator
MTEADTDGRHARRSRNREAVVDAYLDLIRGGNPHPSIADVAERSGVSHRSVFRYFADRDELTRTAIERQQAFLRPLLSLTAAPDLPFDDRLAGFLERRLDLFEAMAPVARLSRSLVLTQPLIAEQLTSSRAFLRSQVEHLFEAELSQLDADARRAALGAIDVLTSFESVELLREDRGWSRDDVRDLLDRSIRTLLDGRPAR